MISLADILDKFYCTYGVRFMRAMIQLILPVMISDLFNCEYEVYKFRHNLNKKMLIIIFRINPS